MRFSRTSRKWAWTTDFLLELRPSKKWRDFYKKEKIWLRKFASSKKWAKVKNSLKMVQSRMSQTKNRLLLNIRGNRTILEIRCTTLMDKFLNTLRNSLFSNWLSKQIERSRKQLNNRRLICQLCKDFYLMMRVALTKWQTTLRMSLQMMTITTMLLRWNPS